jgi:hypothetical protein
MGKVVDFTAWQRSRDEAASSGDVVSALALGHPAGRLRGTPSTDVGVERLDRAVRRLHEMVSTMLDGAGQVQPHVETELLAIMGELTMDLVTEAAARAERLADRLAAKR